ncbi:MAG: nucleoside triphosphate pyrophosphohydrolase [Ruminococcaceae bacterium]|nr:nucleoside triphosphate pyrophosphohydrolase [Oscillospiraceae bacterium]
MIKLKEELLSKKEYDFEDLVKIMTILRSPEGCPWDREQTHQTIRRDLLEETYELIEGIDKNDPEILREELGDVLLQVVFHSNIAKDNGHFSVSDVCNDVCQKLIVRHPHVFGDVKVKDSENVLANWDAIKKETKKQQSDTEVLRSITQSLPSLMRAEKIGKKARKVGFDFDDAPEAMLKVAEEVKEVNEAIAKGNKAEIEEEFGDLFLAVVNAARLAGVDSEQALFNANEKFLARFERVEELCKASGRSVSDTPRDEKEHFWLIAKEK